MTSEENRSTNQISQSPEVGLTLRTTQVVLAVLVVSVVSLIVVYGLPLGERLQVSLVGLSTSIFSACVVALIAEYYLRKEFLSASHKIVAQSLRAELRSLERIQKSGITNVYDRITDDHLIRRFGNAERSIRILQTWMPELPQTYRELAKAAAKERVTIQILVVHPDNPASAMRAEDLGYGRSDWVNSQTRANLANLKRIADVATGNNVEMRAYFGSATMALYEIDGVWLMGMFWRDKPSNTEITIEAARSDSRLVHNFEEHFEHVWEEERTIEISREMLEAGEWPRPQDDDASRGNG